VGAMPLKLLRVGKLLNAQQTSQTNNVDNKLGDNKDTSTISAVNILLGASNGVRLGAFDDNFINASISGATLNNIDQCIERANSKLENTNSMVNKVVILVYLLSPILLYTLFVCDVCCASFTVVFLPSLISGA
jgi:uncharacterized membrane protein YdfJ with MMPL/SSD domain